MLCLIKAPPPTICCKLKEKKKNYGIPSQQCYTKNINYIFHTLINIHRSVVNKITHFERNLCFIFFVEIFNDKNKKKNKKSTRRRYYNVFVFGNKIQGWVVDDVFLTQRNQTY